MSIVINSNISSLTAQRALGKAQDMQQQAMERLSTGQRINSAKDDAAGLAISENFTSQIRGLTQAVRNANDAVSLAQTAEGGLAETTDILQRMRELAVQSANTTLTTADRTSIQSEITALTAEIDRIANTTQYNSSNILDGTAKSLSFQIGDKAGESIGFSIADASAAGLALNTATASGATLTGNVVGAMNAVAVDDISINGFNWAGVETSGTVNGATYTEVINGTSVSTTFDLAQADENDHGAYEIAKAINSNSHNHGVNATARTQIDGIGGTGIETDFTIEVSGAGQTTVIAASYGMQDLVDKINASGGGVTASINEAGGLRLVQAEGKQITLGSGGVGTVGIADGNYHGQISLESIDGTSPIELAVGTNANASAADLTALGFSAQSNGKADENGVATWTVTGQAIVGDTAISGNTNVTINGVELGNTPLNQTVITAADIAASVNAVSSQTGVTADAKTELLLTLNQDSSTVTAYDGTTTLTINGSAVTAGNNVTFSDLVDNINTAMRTAGNDIYATLTETNKIQLVSESGASITIHENDNSGIAADVITAVEVIDGRTVDETGSTTGNNLTDDDAGNNAGAGALTFSGNITYTSTKGPIVFGHVEDGTTALRTTAQTALNILGVQSSNSHLTSASASSAGIDLSSSAKASAAITAIDAALSTVNNMRGGLGALQNRLDHTISSLSSTVENHSASRSRVVDADFAVESAALAKSQVLAQASTAMLAQANAAPQLALQLLQ